MKKRIFALALALCMLLSVMPTSFAAGLTLGGADSTVANGSLSLGGTTSETPGGTTSETPGGTTRIGLSLGGSQTYSTDSDSTSQPSVSLFNTGLETQDEGENSGVLSNGSSSGTTLSGLPTTGQTTGISGVTAAAPVTSPVIDYSSDNLVKRTKMISEPVNGEYKITLGAETEKTSITTSTSRHIVLVLDASLDMKDDGVNNNASVLKNAVDTFISNVAADSPNSQIAIVSYADTAQIHTGEKTYATAFVSVSSDLSSVTQDVLDLTNRNTGTILGKRADLGLKEAARILQTNNAVTGNPIVVLFTNGVPTKNVNVTGNSRWDQDYDAYGIAQDSIHWGVILKSGKNELTVGHDGWENWEYVEYDVNLNQSFYENWSQTEDSIFNETEVGCNAEVYCVGVNLPDGTTGGYPGNDGVKINEFLYRVSSNRPDGSHDGSIGWWNYTNRLTRRDYFLVGNMTGIGDLFDKVETDTSVKLDNIVVKDIVPAYMEIVSAEGATISADKTTATWSNVALSPTSPISKTLIVKFKDGFLGGNAVPTNDAASGLYAVDAETGAETLVGAFGIPTINVDAQAIAPSVRDQNIYLSNDADLKLLIEELHGSIDGVNNDYVDVIYTIKDEDGKSVCTYTVAAGKTAGYWTGDTETALTEDATYTVTCCVHAGKQSDGTENYADTLNASKAVVRVFKPEITFKDTTMYLGTAANYEDNDGSVEWIHASAEGLILGNEPSVKVVYSEDPDVFEDCQEISIVEVLLGQKDSEADEIVYFDENYIEYTEMLNGEEVTTDTDDQFTVHVLTPTVDVADQVIYLSQSVNATDDAVSIVWENKCGHGKELSGAPEASVVFNAGATTLTPETCGSHNAYLKIGTALYPSFKDEFMIHVLVPTVEAENFAMHLGTDVDLNAVVYIDDWACDTACVDGKSVSDVTGNRTAPTDLTYDFYRIGEDAVAASAETGANEYAPDNDTELRVVAKIAGKEYNKKYFADFNINVLMPVITVPQKQVWADYQKSVSMDTWYGSAVSGTAWDETEYNILTTAPTVTCTYEFAVTEGNGNWTSGEEHEEYKQGSADTMMTVTEATWAYADDKTYVATENNKKLVVNSEYDFKINTNKFDLTINKTWMDGEEVADGTYKQDAIFTVSHETFGEVNVVLPSGQESVTVTGLLCGQDYTVTEEDAWTWRWSSSSNDYTVLKAETKHNDVSDEDPHITGYDAGVSFINSLFNRLWLSFCTFVQNIFGLDGIQKGGN